MHKSDIIIQESGLDIEQEENLKNEVRNFIEKHDCITLINGEKIQSNLIDSFEIRTDNISKVHIEGEVN
ncbi:hypothetical protein [Staphylococcus aureus]|uniref:hypothetical protein n=1 Tax=Staphylococcus aureus TaxID=1280 RepID=UPI001372931F|nr:hypothetical protein [Staphylococcus aureus]MDI1632675.1 hypothetical protein [Staphylococcus aureus]HDP2194522.1 hypothetical protein [Staphylococcus aureus]